MPSACGIACEVCGIREKRGCPFDDYVLGTDPKTPEKLEKFKAAMWHACSMLECATKIKWITAQYETNFLAMFIMSREVHTVNKALICLKACWERS